MAAYDILIQEATGKKRKILIPWLPEKIIVDGNETGLVTYSILNLGDVNVASGQDLKEVSWSSYFPGAKHKDLPFLRDSWQDPKNYQTLLEDWRSKGTELRLTVSGTKISYRMQLQDFTIAHEGGSGDYTYDISFIQYRELTVSVVSTTKKSSKAKSTSVGNKAAKTKTYTIKKGDTLWAIAKKYLGSGTKWKTLYNLNKSAIESAAKKHGKKNSNSGNLIYPGTKLKLQ